MTRQVFLDPLPDGSVRPFTEAEEEWYVPTGRIGIDHVLDLTFTDETLLYGSISRGYKAGGLNPGGPVGGESFDPEYLNALEFGSKNVLNGGRAIANFSAFYYDYEGLQVGQVGETSAITVNADAEIYGAEAEFQFLPAENLAIDLNIAYLNTELSAFESADQGDPLAQTAGTIPALDATGAVRTTASGEVIQNLSGNALPNSPEWSVRFGAQYDFQLNGGWMLTPRVDHYWQEDMFATSFNKPSDVLDGWSQTDIQIGLSNPDKAWGVRAFAKNIFENDDVIRRGQDGPLVGRFRSVTVLEPLLYGVELNIDF